jgi:hypothetical protein
MQEFFCRILKEFFLLCSLRPLHEVFSCAKFFGPPPLITFLMHLSMLSPSRVGGRAYVGHLIFLSNFQSNVPPSGNKYWSNTPPFWNKYCIINKNHLVKIALTRSQSANQIPEGGDAIDVIDDQVSHIYIRPPPPPPWGLTSIGA